MSGTPHEYGLIAEFKDGAALVAAAGRARAAGYRRLDAFSPFAVPGLVEALGKADRKALWVGIAGAVLGALAGFFMQVWTVLDYPLNVGGRPTVTLTGFAYVSFEMMVLFAAIFGVVGMLVLNGLPRLHHPLFGVERFKNVTLDGFFLVIESDDPAYERDRTSAFLDTLGPLYLGTVPR